MEFIVVAYDAETGEALYNVAPDNEPTFDETPMGYEEAKRLKAENEAYAEAQMKADPSLIKMYFEIEEVGLWRIA